MPKELYYHHNKIGHNDLTRRVSASNLLCAIQWIHLISVYACHHSSMDVIDVQPMALVFSPVTYDRVDHRAVYMWHTFILPAFSLSRYYYITRVNIQHFNFFKWILMQIKNCHWLDRTATSVHYGWWDALVMPVNNLWLCSVIQLCSFAPAPCSENEDKMIFGRCFV